MTGSQFSALTARICFPVAAAPGNKTGELRLSTYVCHSLKLLVLPGAEGGPILMSRVAALRFGPNKGTQEIAPFV